MIGDLLDSQQAHAGAVEVDELDPVGALRPEDVDRAGERLCGAPHNAERFLAWRRAERRVAKAR